MAEKVSIVGVERIGWAPNIKNRAVAVPYLGAVVVVGSALRYFVSSLGNYKRRLLAVRRGIVSGYGCSAFLVKLRKRGRVESRRQASDSLAMCFRARQGYDDCSSEHAFEV